MYGNLRLGGLGLVVLMALATQSRATMYDLTAANSSETINGAEFKTFDIAPTGSGKIVSFVRLKELKEGGTAIESGYNTDGRPTFYQENSSKKFTRSLLLSDVPQVQLDDGWFYEFGLDINQERSSPLLSLDVVKIYRYNVGDYKGDVAGLGTPLYDLDNPAGSPDADNWIKLNYTLGRGSGQGDMYAYIPISQLNGGTGDYVYLYSTFGAQGGDLANNDGFEEWFVRGNLTPPPVPVPAAGLLGLLGLGAAGLKLRRFV